MRLSRRFTFSASHSLPGNFPEGSKNANVHGHTYRATVTVEGTPNKKTRWICDSGEIERVWNGECFAFLDHALLNDMMETPTSEEIALWIMDRMSEAMRAHVVGVTVERELTNGVETVEADEKDLAAYHQQLREKQRKAWKKADH